MTCYTVSNIDEFTVSVWRASDRLLAAMDPHEALEQVLLEEGAPPHLAASIRSLRRGGPYRGRSKGIKAARRIQRRLLRYCPYEWARAWERFCEATGRSTTARTWRYDVPRVNSPGGVA